MPSFRSERHGSSDGPVAVPPPAIGPPPPPPPPPPPSPPPPPPPLGGTGAGEFGVSIPGDRILYQTPAQQDAELMDIVALGAKWVRTDCRWSAISAQGWTIFGPFVDRVNAHGLNLLPVVGVSFPGGYGPGDAAAFGTFCTDVGNELAGRVPAYEIWNEENGSFWSGTVAQYTAFLQAAYSAIKPANPAAPILVGGFVPGGAYTDPDNSVKYLEGIYANGGLGHFDAVANHPYTGGTTDSNGTQAWNNWYQMFGSTPSLHSVMSGEGDGSKEIWGTEWGQSLVQDPAPDEATIQARIATDVANWKALGSQVGPLFWYTDRDDGTLGYGLSLTTYPLSHRPRYASYQAAIAA